jgi:hypothetical protein
VAQTPRLPVVEDGMEVEFLACPTCTEVTMVEMPPCSDEHGFDCPDRACTMCGTALTMAGVVMGSGLMGSGLMGSGLMGSDVMGSDVMGGDVTVNRAGRAARRKRPAA